MEETEKKYRGMIARALVIAPGRISLNKPGYITEGTKASIREVDIQKLKGDSPDKHKYFIFKKYNENAPDISKSSSPFEEFFRENEFLNFLNQKGITGLVPELVSYGKQEFYDQMTLLEKTVESESLRKVFQNLEKTVDNGSPRTRFNKSLDHEKHYSYVKNLLKNIYAPFYSIVSKESNIKDLEKRFRESSKEHEAEIESKLGKKRIGLKVNSTAKSQRNLGIYIDKLLENNHYPEQIKSLEPFLNKSSDLISRYNTPDMEVVAPHDGYLQNLTFTSMLDMGNVGKVSKGLHLGSLLCDPLIFENFGDDASPDHLDQKESRIRHLLHDLNSSITYPGQKFDIDSMTNAIAGLGIYSNLRLAAGYLSQGGHESSVNRLLDTAIDLTHILIHHGELK